LAKKAKLKINKHETKENDKKLLHKLITVEKKDIEKIWQNCFVSKTGLEHKILDWWWNKILDISLDSEDKGIEYNIKWKYIVSQSIYREYHYNLLNKDWEKILEADKLYVDGNNVIFIQKHWVFLYDWSSTEILFESESPSIIHGKLGKALLHSEISILCYTDKDGLISLWEGEKKHKKEETDTMFLITYDKDTYYLPKEVIFNLDTDLNEDVCKRIVEYTSRDNQIFYKDKYIGDWKIYWILEWWSALISNDWKYFLHTNNELKELKNASAHFVPNIYWEFVFYFGKGSSYLVDKDWNEVLESREGIKSMDYDPCNKRILVEREWTREVYQDELSIKGSRKWLVKKSKNSKYRQYFFSKNFEKTEKVKETKKILDDYNQSIKELAALRFDQKRKSLLYSNLSIIQQPVEKKHKLFNLLRQTAKDLKKELLHQSKIDFGLEQKTLSEFSKKTTWYFIKTEKNTHHLPVIAQNDLKNSSSSTDYAPLGLEDTSTWTVFTFAPLPAISTEDRDKMNHYAQTQDEQKQLPYDITQILVQYIGTDLQTTLELVKNIINNNFWYDWKHTKTFYGDKNCLDKSSHYATILWIKQKFAWVCWDKATIIVAILQYLWIPSVVIEWYTINNRKKLQTPWHARPAILYPYWDERVHVSFDVWHKFWSKYRWEGAPYSEVRFSEKTIRETYKEEMKKKEEKKLEKEREHIRQKQWISWQNITDNKFYNHKKELYQKLKEFTSVEDKALIEQLQLLQLKVLYTSDSENIVSKSWDLATFHKKIEPWIDFQSLKNLYSLTQMIRDESIATICDALWIEIRKIIL